MLAPFTPCREGIKLRFRYLKDPLFIVSAAAYCINRAALKPAFSTGFVHDYLNDLICVPFWLPVMVSLQKALGWRAGDKPPQAPEAMAALILWSAVFEILLPHAFQIGVSDSWDIVCYAAGAFVATVFWSVWYSRASTLVPSIPECGA